MRLAMPLAAILLAWLSQPLDARGFRCGESLRPAVEYSYVFDNREFARSGDSFQPSGTCNFVRLTPCAVWSSGEQSLHQSLTLGADVLWNMGGGAELPEPLLWYSIAWKSRKGGVLRADAGIFPRALLSDQYSEAVCSRDVVLYDFSLEGMHYSWRSEKFFAEISLDWIGRKEGAMRERFEVLTSGLWQPCPWLSAGWSGGFLHYAASEVVSGVMENNVLNPYLKFSVPECFADELSLRCAALLSYQRDRRNDHLYRDSNGGSYEGTPYRKYPGAAEFVLSLCKGPLRFAGTAVVMKGDLQPFRDCSDATGAVYSDLLYRGSPQYRSGSFARAEMAWNPRLSKRAVLSLKARFHFGFEDGYRGCEQVVALKVGIGR